MRWMRCPTREAGSKSFAVKGNGAERAGDTGGSCRGAGVSCHLRLWRSSRRRRRRRLLQLNDLTALLCGRTRTGRLRGAGSWVRLL